MFLPDDIIASSVNQEVALKSRLLIVGGNARLKTVMGAFGISEPIVDADNNRRVLIHYILYLLLFQYSLVMIIKIKQAFRLLDSNVADILSAATSIPQRDQNQEDILSF